MMPGNARQIFTTNSSDLEIDLHVFQWLAVRPGLLLRRLRPDEHPSSRQMREIPCGWNEDARRAPKGHPGKCERSDLATL
jgi:hypothetical protein